MLPSSSSSLLCSARIDYFGLLNQPQQQRQRQQPNKKKTNDDGSGRGSGADSDSHLQFLNCWLILLPSPCCNCNDKFVFSVLFWSLDSRAPLPISRSLSSLSLSLSLSHYTWRCAGWLLVLPLLCSALPFGQFLPASSLPLPAHAVYNLLIVSRTSTSTSTRQRRLCCVPPASLSLSSLSFFVLIREFVGQKVWMVMLRKGRYAEGGGSYIKTSCSCADFAVAPCNNKNDHATAVRRGFVSIEQGASIDNLQLQVV